MRKKNNKNTTIKQLVIKLIVFVILIAVTYIIQYIDNEFGENLDNKDIAANASTAYFSIEDIPEFTNEIYITINNNIPYFNEEEYTTKSFEKYSDLDYLGRCGVAYANVCKEIMPPEGEERGNISSVRPTGWRQTKYNGEYLYNRCHLIAHSLSDEDANELNLITGTRYFNVQGMLIFEKQVAEYIYKNQNNHVLYRVTPIFKGDNLLASGVEMEAYSVEDNGEGVCFNVYVYNVQPGVNINYATGEVIQ